MVVLTIGSGHVREGPSTEIRVFVGRDPRPGVCPRPPLLFHALMASLTSYRRFCVGMLSGLIDDILSVVGPTPSS